MDYAKPDVVFAGLAIKAIESMAKEDQLPIDSSLARTTPSAYQADE